MRASLLLRLLKSLVVPSLLCPEFASPIVFHFLNHLEAIHASFLPLICIHYSIRQITSQKAEHATEATKNLQDMTGESISVRTVRRAFKKAGMRAVVKRKRPLLTKWHGKARMDFALAHKDWTMEDWKRVVWSDETKTNCLDPKHKSKKATKQFEDRECHRF